MSATAEPSFSFTGQAAADGSVVSGCEECGDERPVANICLVRLGQDDKVWRLCRHCRYDHRMLHKTVKPA